MAEPFGQVFGLSGKTKSLCISAMRIISISYVFAGANIAFQGIFQALDSGIESLVISICRQFLFIIPMAYVFTQMIKHGNYGTWLVWLSFVITEILSVTVAIIFMKKVYGKKVITIENN